LAVPLRVLEESGNYFKTDAFRQKLYFEELVKHGFDANVCYGNLIKTIMYPSVKLSIAPYTVYGLKKVMLSNTCTHISEFTPLEHFYSLYSFRDRYFVVDIDTKADLFYLKLLLGNTLIEETRKGYHFIFEDYLPGEADFVYFTYYNIPMTIIRTLTQTPYTYLFGELYVKPLELRPPSRPDKNFLTFIHNIV
jgi:hypothetical protein